MNNANRTCQLSGLWTVALGLAACSGCGSGLTTVQGSISFDGEPVQEGSIAFEPLDGRGPVAGGAIQNGKYNLRCDSAVMPGTKKVRIIGVRKTGRKIEVGPPAPPGMMVDEVEHYIPNIYGPESTLTCEFVSGKVNQHNFDLPRP